MANICNASIHLCRIRVTRLDQLGNPTAGPNNSYVSDSPIMLAVKPQVQAGENKTVIGGCDCIVAEYRGYDKLKRFDLELDLGLLEPALVEMLTGGAAILDGAGDPIGVWWPTDIACSDPAQPNVAFEGWTDLWEDDHQATSPYQYVHWVWPSTHWMIADHTLQNDFLQPKLTAFSRGNPNWGLGIYGDYPEAAEPLGGWFYSNSIPAAYCGYQSEPLT